jgi:hypothetical protein
MSKYLNRPDLFDQLIVLNEDQKRNPKVVIERFFGDYRLHECRDILHNVLEVCLSTDNAAFSEPGAREDLIMQVRHFEELLEASYCLAKSAAQ